MYGKTSLYGGRINHCKRTSLGKKIFIAELIKLTDLLPVDWDQIDPDNPAPAPEDRVASNETVMGKLSKEQKVLWTVHNHIKTKMFNALPEVYLTGKINELDAAKKLALQVFYFSNTKTFGCFTDKNFSGLRSGYRFVSGYTDIPAEILSLLSNFP